MPYQVSWDVTFHMTFALTKRTHEQVGIITTTMLVRVLIGGGGKMVVNHLEDQIGDLKEGKFGSGRALTGHVGVNVTGLDPLDSALIFNIQAAETKACDTGSDCGSVASLGMDIFVSNSTMAHVIFSSAHTWTMQTCCHCAELHTSLVQLVLVEVHLGSKDNSTLRVSIWLAFFSENVC